MRSFEGREPECRNCVGYAGRRKVAVTQTKAVEENVVCSLSRRKPTEKYEKRLLRIKPLDWRGWRETDRKAQTTTAQEPSNITSWMHDKHCKHAHGMRQRTCNICLAPTTLSHPHHHAFTNPIAEHCATPLASYLIIFSKRALYVSVSAGKSWPLSLVGIPRTLGVEGCHVPLVRRLHDTTATDPRTGRPGGGWDPSRYPNNKFGLWLGFPQKSWVRP